MGLLICRTARTSSVSIGRGTHAVSMATPPEDRAAGGTTLTGLDSLAGTLRLELADAARAGAAAALKEEAAEAEDEEDVDAAVDETVDATAAEGATGGIGSHTDVPWPCLIPNMSKIGQCVTSAALVALAIDMNRTGILWKYTEKIANGALRRML